MVESRNGFDASPVRIALVTDAWHPQVNGVVTTLNQVKTNLEAAAHELPIVGDGPAMTRVKKQYPRAHFVGFKHGEELAQHFAASDVFVFPSRTDTFGVVMLEAMASGLPVAAYPVTGPIDVVAPGRSGVLHDDLRTAALEALKLDPAECRRYAEGFSWKRCADMFFANLAPIGGEPSWRSG